VSDGLIVALVAGSFAILAAYRLSRIWHELPEHLAEGPRWLTSDTSPIRLSLKALLPSAIGMFGMALIGVGELIRQSDSSASRIGPIAMLIGAALFVIGLLFALTIWLLDWPQRMLPHPYRSAKSNHG
jgi:hypothetical protein